MSHSYRSSVEYDNRGVNYFCTFYNLKKVNMNYDIAKELSEYIHTQKYKAK